MCTLGNLIISTGCPGQAWETSTQTPPPPHTSWQSSAWWHDSLTGRIWIPSGFLKVSMYSRRKINHLPQKRQENNQSSQLKINNINRVEKQQYALLVKILLPHRDYSTSSYISSTNKHSNKTDSILVLFCASRPICTPLSRNSTTLSKSSSLNPLEVRAGAPGNRHITGSTTQLQDTY